MKTVDFSETIAACDLKNCVYNKTCVCFGGECHFLTLVQGHLHMKMKTSFSQKPLGHL